MSRTIALTQEHGFKLVLNAGIAVADVTSAEFIFRAPDGTTTAKAATNTGDDQRWEYTVEAGLLSQTGSWGVQLVLKGIDFEFRGSIFNFTVGESYVVGP